MPRACCRQRLQPRVPRAYRDEQFDREIMREMGALGFPTVPSEYGEGGRQLRRLWPDSA
jgi:glutaryl-CoA dehydrogenase